jgi:hypothetical protein
MVDNYSKTAAMMEDDDESIPQGGGEDNEDENVEEDEETEEDEDFEDTSEDDDDEEEEDDDDEEEEEDDDEEERDEDDDDDFEHLCDRMSRNDTDDCFYIFFVDDDDRAFRLAGSLNGNTTVTKACVYLNKKVSKAGVRALAQGLVKSNVAYLSLSDEGIPWERTEYQSDVLWYFCKAAMKKVSILNILGQMCDKTAMGLSRMLSSHSCSLEELSLSCIYTQQEKAHTLYEGIRNSNIVKLKLQGNPPFCRILFSKGVLQLPKLRHVEIETCAQGSTMHTVQDSNIFGELPHLDNNSSSQQTSNLESLHLNLRQFLGNDEVPFLLRAIGRNPSLKILKIEQNTIGDQGISSLIQGWGEWPRLETLDLSHNIIGVAGLCQLLNAASIHPSLKSLDLSWNENIGKENFQNISQELIDGLQRSSQLRELNLRFCCLKDIEVAVLAKGLCHNRSIKTLRLGNNNIGDQGVNSLVDSFKNGLQLEELQLSSIRAAGVRNLVKVSYTHPSLTALFLASCGPICHSELFLIAKELKNSKLLKLTLTVKNICFGEVYEKACDALVDAVRCNMHLEELDLIDISFRAKQAIIFFLGTAKALRQLLKLDNEPPPGLWCHVLAKCGNTDSSLLFYLLEEKPSLIPAVERMAAKKRERSKSSGTEAPPGKRPSSFVSCLEN